MNLKKLDVGDLATEYGATRKNDFLVLTGQTISGREIEVHRDLKIDEGLWVNCHFRVGESVKLEFANSSFERCTIESYYELIFENEPHLKMLNTSATTLKIIGAWQSILLQRGPRMRSWGNSELAWKSDFTKIQELSIHESSILFASRRLEIRGTTIQKSNWTPSVTLETIASDVSFPESTVTLDGWITTCADRNTLDLHSADILIDKWATLRETYTGLNLFITIFLTILAFLPYGLKAMLLIGLSHTSDSLLPSPIPTTPLWQALLYGGHVGFVGIVISIAGVLILIYNFVRFILTKKIAALREREEHLSLEGFLNGRPNAMRLHILWVAHQCLRVLTYIAFFAGAARIALAMFEPVPDFSMFDQIFEKKD